MNTSKGVILERQKYVVFPYLLEDFIAGIWFSALPLITTQRQGVNEVSATPIGLKSWFAKGAGGQGYRQDWTFKEGLVGFMDQTSVLLRILRIRDEKRGEWLAWLCFLSCVCQWVVREVFVCVIVTSWLESFLSASSLLSTLFIRATLFFMFM